MIQKYRKEFSARGIVPGLTAMENLLDLLGHPQEDLSVVHIAGTNGKGSTLAFLASILEEAGFRAGRYVSPAVTSYAEHFQINGDFIDLDRLADYYEQMGKAIDVLKREGKALPTLFEVETAIAFTYFKEEKTDYALIETGMGGLLDATNVVRAPLLTMISSVSYDHMAWLGDSLSKIASQKAGIIKPHVPVILAENPEEVVHLIKARAKECGSPCILVKPQDYELIDEDQEGSAFCWRGTGGRPDILCRINLPGRHQVSNAAAAIHAAQCLLKDPIDPSVIARGLDRTRWPGRLEIIGRDPLTYRDGAHNPDGALRLAGFLQKHFTNRRIIYIIGMLKDKEYDKMLDHTMPLAQKAYVFRPDIDRGLDARVLADLVRSMGKEAVLCTSVTDALAAARKEADPSDVLVVWGSLSFMEDMEGV